MHGRSGMPSLIGAHPAVPARPPSLDDKPSSIKSKPATRSDVVVGDGGDRGGVESSNNTPELEQQVGLMSHDAKWTHPTTA